MIPDLYERLLWITVTAGTLDADSIDQLVFMEGEVRRLNVDLQGAVLIFPAKKLRDATKNVDHLNI